MSKSAQAPGGFYNIAVVSGSRGFVLRSGYRALRSANQSRRAR